MKRILTIFLFLTVGYLAAQPDSLFTEANEAYRTENYRQAAELYRALADSGYQNEALFYNLGNSYYQSGQIGESILYFEKALSIDPDDEETRQNLDIVRKRTVDEFEVMPDSVLQTAGRSILRFFSPDQWTFLALFLLALIPLSLFVYFFSPMKRLGFTGLLIGLILGGTCLALAYGHRNWQKHNQGAIIMSPSAYVKSAPASSSEDVLILHEGTKAVVVEKLDEWRKIRLPDGKLGWIKAADLAMI